MSEFADSLHEVFERFGRVSLRRMFGGYGVYHDDRMFALVAGDRLYLKTDAATVGAFEEKRLVPFEYARQGKIARMSYHEAPAEVFEDRDEAAVWARRAWEAALRSGARKARVEAHSAARPKAKPNAKR